MRIAIVSPPFIATPPSRYGGTELFVATLARELHACGHAVTVYTNGESRLPCEIRWRYRDAEWPLTDATRAHLKNADHTAWAIRDASATADVIHLNDIVGVPFTRFIDIPVVLTIHHPHEPPLSEQYSRYPEIDYVAIAGWLAAREPMPKVHVVRHGISLDDYAPSVEKDDYVAFLGRMAPCKAPHLAIAAARAAGVSLKLAGEVQPAFAEYWTTQVEPEIDGAQIEFVGDVDLEAKCRILSRARALLFPIEWEEPFGLVMIEAMACGTPVLAFRGGAVDEIVIDGVNGWACRDVADMAERIRTIDVAPETCREFVRARFGAGRMADEYVRVYESAIGAHRLAGASRHDHVA
ncbi:MAG TPA: glycosyltransferase family 4 protein [Vicinamibacterales bacterium]|nr:glycosyltransferase family 4 protein [Vicinamibacterales bacterium]